MRAVDIEIAGGKGTVVLFKATEGLEIFWRCVRLLKTLFPKFDGGNGRDLMNALASADLTVLYNALDVSGVDPTTVLSLSRDLLRQTMIVRNGEAYDLARDDRFNDCFEGNPLEIIMVAWKAAAVNFGESFKRLNAGADPLGSTAGAKG